MAARKTKARKRARPKQKSKIELARSELLEITDRMSFVKSIITTAELAISNYVGGQEVEVSAVLHFVLTNELDPLTERISAVIKALGTGKGR